MRDVYRAVSEGFRIFGGGDRVRRDGKKTAYDGDREYHFVGLDDPSLYHRQRLAHSADRIR